MRWVCGLTAVAMALMSLIANSVQTVHDKQKVAKMTEKMKTLCVGRFLIDLPVEAQVTFKHGAVGGMDIASTDRESDAEFAQRLRRTESDLAQAVNDDGGPSLETDKLLAVGDGHGKTFIYNRRRTKVLKEDGFVFSENLAMLSMLRFEKVSITGDIEWVAPRYIDSMNRILSRIRPIAAQEIPQESGFCLGHAIVRDPYDHDNLESVVMFSGLPDHPDVNLVLSSMVDTVQAPGLLERNAKASAREPLVMQMAFANLRQHVRSIQGLAGEELVMRVREPNFTTGYSFQWEMTGERNNVFAPRLKLELESGVNPVSGGKPVQSTLTEEAMFALWERVLGSIRVRPSRAEIATPVEPAAVALGAGTFAGEVCPHTGWWRCADGGNGIGVLGGQRQFMKKGERLPQALLLPRQTLWQKLRGLQPGYETSASTLWTLSDKRNRQRPTPASGFAHAITVSEPDANASGSAASGHVEMPLGSVAGTGDTCPASGWWRCVDIPALDGTRWFAAGSLLPAATFQSSASGRATASPKVVHRRSRWTLVRIVDRPFEADTAAPAQLLSSQ